MAYIGSYKAIADLPFMNANFADGGSTTFLFWRSAYVVLVEEPDVGVERDVSRERRN